MTDRSLQPWRAAVAAGPGVVVRFEVGVLVFAGTPEQIRVSMQAVGADRLDQSAQELLTSLRTAIGEHEVAGVVETDEGLRALAAAVMQVRTDDDEVLSRTTRVDQVLEAEAGAWIGAGDPPSGPADAWMDLRLGSVPGVGVVIWNASAAEQNGAAGERAAFVPSADGVAVAGQTRVAKSWPTTPPDLAHAARMSRPVPIRPPVPAAAVDQPVEPPSPTIPGMASVGARTTGGLAGAFAAATDSAPGGTSSAAAGSPSFVPASAPAVAPGAVPDIEGIFCTNQHFTRPNARLCHVCQMPVDRDRAQLVRGPRPPLGRLTFDDGQVAALDRELMIGRDPQTQDRGAVQPLIIADQNKSVSRSHAEVFFDGWEVGLVDLESSNGTFRWNRVLGTWQQLEPLVPIRLVDGDMMSVGQRRFVFEGL